MIISHLTDVEGNLRYFQQWANRSKYIQFKNAQLSFRKALTKHAFIYGGDFCDKGPGDLRIGQALTDFKTHNPLNVSLIAGNRDIKCRRFTYELDSNIRQRLLKGAPAFWNPHATPKLYVAQQMIAAGFSSPTMMEIERFIQNQTEQSCKTLYLKWMLHETMGSASTFNKPDAFEYRRMELAAMTDMPVKQVFDEQVTDSFLDSVSADGVVTNYLKLAQLGVIVGETLFIHGAVTPDNMGYVPGMTDAMPRITQVDEWIETLNHWYAQEITDWINNPIETYLHAPGHKALDHYVILNPQSVVTTNWYTHGQLMPISDKVVEFLNRSGIYRVVSGHQPFSDFPLIIRNPNLEVIVGDTGYSDRLAKEDCRGKAIHNLDIVQSKTSSYASIDAIRADGTPLSLTLPTQEMVYQDKDTEIGHFNQDGRLIRPLSDGSFVGSQLDGYAVIDRLYDL